MSYRVRVGSTQWASGGQLVDVSSSNIFIHPEYNKAASFDYDIAVLRVSKDLVFGQAVQAVTMVPVSKSVVANTEITLIGWGYTDVSMLSSAESGSVCFQTSFHPGQR